jgi:hypothetical protein
MNRSLELSSALLLLVGCSGETNSGAIAPDAGTNAETGTNIAEPPVHRPQTEACPTTRAPGVEPAIVGACKADADCTQGKNGRCTFGPAISSVCSYDECAKDSDCASGVCVCRLETYAGANVCFRGNCVTDADCGAKGYCSPSGPELTNNCRSNVPPGSFGYFCRTSRDQCQSTVDCGETGTCLFSVDANRWECLPKRCTR